MGSITQNQEYKMPATLTPLPSIRTKKMRYSINETLNRWETKSSQEALRKFTFDDIYSVMVTDQYSSLNDLLAALDIDRATLEKSTNTKVVNAITNIDKLIRQSAEIVRNFVVENVLTNAPNDYDLLSNRSLTNGMLSTIYAQMMSEFDDIKEQLQMQKISKARY